MSEYEADTFVRDKMREARELLHEAIDHHEATEHGGSACAMERTSMVAFLAHSAGITLSMMPLLAATLAEYETAHHDHNGSG